jgi:hypothetical protein
VNLIEIATIVLGSTLLGGFALWYYKDGHKSATSGASIVSRFFSWVRFEFDNPTARQVALYVRETCKSTPLTWFMFGVAFEAFGLGIQYMFAMDVYPLLDFLVAGIIATALYVHQNRKVKDAKLA